MAEIRTDIAETFERKRVAFYECDYKERFRLSEVLRLSAEIAGRDYTDKGLSHEYLWQHGMVFLVSKVSFKIYKYPTSQQKLISSTWESGKKGAMFMRGFEIKSEDGERLVAGDAGWVLANPETRRIIRPSSFPYSMPQIRNRESGALPIAKIAMENSEKLGEYQVRISDIDGNGHLYNANYADIAVNFLPIEFYGKDVDNFRIDFISEAKLGDVIEIYGEILEDKAVVMGTVEGKKCFECEFISKTD